MKKTICFLFLLVMLMPTLSFAATFWGEDLPPVQTTLYDVCGFPEYRAKVSPNPNGTKRLEVWQDPTCGSGNFHQYYRLDLESGVIYSKEHPSQENRLVSAPKNNSDYPVAVRRMERRLRKIKEGTFQADGLLTPDYENALMISNYLTGNILKKSPQFHAVNHPQEIPANQGVNLLFRVTGDFLHLDSFVIQIWTQGENPAGIQTVDAVPVSVDAKGRGLYQASIPASLVTGDFLRWSAVTSARVETEQETFSVKDERPDHLGPEQNYPFFLIPIVP